MQPQIGSQTSIAIIRQKSAYPQLGNHSTPQHTTAHHSTPQHTKAHHSTPQHSKASISQSTKSNHYQTAAKQPQSATKNLSIVHVQPSLVRKTTRKRPKINDNILLTLFTLSPASLSI
jgi:hypothetical protein